MTSSSHRSVTPRDVARIVFRQWRKLALVFFGISTLTVLSIALYPRAYRSEAKLLIRVGRETVGLDPTATTGETIMLQKTQEDEVNSAVNILSSHEVLRGVVERIGAERILTNGEPSEQHDGEASLATSMSSVVGEWKATIGGWLETLRLSDPGTEVDRAIRRLDSQMNVSAPKQSMVITVTYTASNPHLAHDVVASMVDVFLEKHSSLNQTDGSLEFFAKQVEKMHGDLLSAQAELRDRKNVYQLTSSGNRQSILEKAKEAMRQKIYDLAVQESELRSRYTDAYPPLREVQRQREQAQRLLTSFPASPAAEEAGGTASPAAVGRLDVVEQNKLDSELKTLNDQEFELAQLQREVDLLEGKYAMHVQKLEQARLNDELGRGRIRNIKVAQPATLVQKPVAPKKLVILGLGLMMAVFGSIGVAFLSESLDQTLRTTDQVEMELGLPVVASLPLRKHRRKQRRIAAIDRPTGSAARDGTGGERRRDYANLVTALKPSGENGHRRVKTIGVVGCDTSVINSRVAGDLAIQAASSGQEPVLLIDADARRRRVSKRFRVNGVPGWQDVAAGSAAAESCIQWSQPGSLAVMSPGGIPGDTRDEAAANGVPQLGGIKSEYGLVVIDLPPARELNGRATIAGLADEIVLVVEAERTRIQAARRARDLLDRAGVHVTGVVLANRRDHIPRWLYQRL